MALSTKLKKWLPLIARRPLSSETRKPRRRNLFLEQLEARDCPAAIGFMQSPLTTPENVGSYNLNNFVVQRTGDLTLPETVNWAVTDGTAVLGVDYSRTGTTNSPGTALSGSVTFAAGVGGTQSLSGLVNIVDTLVVHPDGRYLSVVLSNASGSTDTISNADNQLQITDCAPGLPVITSIVPSVTNNDVVITVARQGGSYGPLNVPYQTLDGTAIAGTDYTATTGTLSWASGDISNMTVTVPVLDYATLSGSLTFSLDLGDTGIPSPSAYWSFNTADNLNTNPNYGIITDLSGNGNNLVDVARDLGGSTRGSYGFSTDAPFTTNFADGTSVDAVGTSGATFADPGQDLTLVSGTAYTFPQADITGATWNSGGESASIASASNANGTTAVIETSAANTFVTGEMLRISGVSTVYDTTTPVAITVIDNQDFSYTIATSGNTTVTPAASNDAMAYASSVAVSAATLSGNTVTITPSTPITGAGIAVGASVVISGMTPSGYNGTYTVTGISTAVDSATGNTYVTSFTYTDTNNPQNINGTQLVSSVSIFSASESGNTVTITPTGAENFSSGETVTISGLSDSAFNGTYTLTGTGGAPNVYTFTYTDPTANLEGGSISTATESDNTVTITTSAANNFTTGESVVIYGVGLSGYNGIYTITATDVGGNANAFSYTDSTPDLPSSSGGTAGLSGAGGSAVLSMTAATGFGAAAFGNMTFTTDLSNTVQQYNTVLLGDTSTNSPGVGNSAAINQQLAFTSSGGGTTAFAENTIFTVSSLSSANQFVAISGSGSTSTVNPGLYVAGGTLNGNLGQGPTWFGPEAFLVGGDTNGFGNPITTTDTNIYVNSTVGFPTSSSALPFYIELGSTEIAQVVGEAPGTGAFAGSTQFTIIRDVSLPDYRAQASVSGHSAGTPVILVITAATGVADNNGNNISPLAADAGYQNVLGPFNTDAPLTISGAFESGTTVTITVSIPVGNIIGYALGQSVTLAGFTGANAGYNGTYAVTGFPGTASNEFTFTSTSTGLPTLASVSGATVAGIDGNLPNAGGDFSSGADNNLTDPRYYVSPHLDSLGTAGALGYNAGANSNVTSSGTLTYSFWLNLPENNGASYDTSTQAWLNQSFTILGHESDPSQGGEYGGEVQAQTIPNYNNGAPGSSMSSPLYTLAFRDDNSVDGNPASNKLALNVQFPANQWNMFTLEFTPQGLEIYQNGQFKQMLSSMGTYNWASSKQVIDAINGYFRINNTSQSGATLNQGGDFQLDDLGIWQQTLTPAQIKDIYANGIGGAWDNKATITIGSNAAGVQADVITTQPAGQAIKVGSATSFSVNTYNGVGPDTVQWQVSTNNGASYSTISDTAGLYSGTATGTLDVLGSPTASILSAAESGNTVTIQTTAATPFAVGDTVVISGVQDVVNGVDDLDYDGTFTLTSVSTTTNANDTFTYTAQSGLTTATSLVGASALDTMNGYLYQAVITNNSGNGPATLTSNPAPLSVDMANAYFTPTTSYPTDVPNQALLGVSNVNTNQTVGLYATSPNPTGSDSVIWYQSIDGGYNFTLIPPSQLPSSETASAQPQLYYSNVVQANLGLYKAVYTNSSGAFASNVLTLTDAGETITAPPTDTIVDFGGTATFTASATAETAGDEVSWQRSTDGGVTWTLYNAPTSITSGTATLTISDVTPAQNGYEYRAAFANGTLLTNAVTLTVDYITQQPTSVTIAAGSNTSFTAASSNPGNADTVQWEVSTDGGMTYANVTNSSIYSGATTTTLTITGALASMNGDLYIASFGNSYNGNPLNSNPATLTVTSPISLVSRTVNGDLLNVTSTISSAVESAGSSTVQITTSSADGFYVGELVQISNVGTAEFNGTYTVASVTDATDFTYSDANFDASSPGSISNGGSAANALAGVQRSMVDSVTYVFNQAVTLGTGAISMDVNSGYTGTTGVVPTISYATIDDGHTWLVTFSGSSVTGNSIADGVYDITLNSSAVTADAGGATLATSQTDTFYRFFGDSNGDASVTSRPDVQNFAAAFGTSSTSTAYLAYFDYNADGSITSRPDVQNFATRFGTSLTGFTPTI